MLSKLYVNLEQSCFIYFLRLLEMIMRMRMVIFPHVSEIKFLDVFVDENYHEMPMSSHIQKSKLVAQEA